VIAMAHYRAITGMLVDFYFSPQPGGRS